MTRKKDFVASLQQVLGPALGSPLKSVVYRCIENGCDDKWIQETSLYIAGEIEVTFVAQPPVFIGWAENDGWRDHFSLFVDRQSSFKPDSLVSWDATKTPLWSAALDRPLKRLECRGSNATPHLLYLDFGLVRVIV